MIQDANAQDFETELVGHKIIGVTDETLTLDDGTVLLIEDNADCCAWFNGSVKGLNEDIADNVITNVKYEDYEDGEDGDEHYAIVILAGNAEVTRIDVSGNPTSGYYCHSIGLEVKRA